MTAYKVATAGPTLCSRPVSGIATPQRRRRYDKSQQLCVADEDHDDNQPSAPKYVDDGDNYPIVPITATGNHDHGHDRDNR